MIGRADSKTRMHPHFKESTRVDDENVRKRRQLVTPVSPEKELGAERKNRRSTQTLIATRNITQNAYKVKEEAGSCKERKH
jgi:hypothetical protein